MAAEGFFSYTVTGANFEDVVEFYQEEMLALDWTLVDNSGGPNFANLGFTKDGVRVDFTISQQGDIINILILET